RVDGRTASRGRGRRRRRQRRRGRGGDTARAEGRLRVAEPRRVVRSGRAPDHMAVRGGHRAQRRRRVDAGSGRRRRTAFTAATPRGAGGRAAGRGGRDRCARAARPPGITGGNGGCDRHDRRRAARPLQLGRPRILARAARRRGRRRQGADLPRPRRPRRRCAAARLAAGGSVGPGPRLGTALIATAGMGEPTVPGTFGSTAPLRGGPLVWATAVAMAFAAYGIGLASGRSEMLLAAGLGLAVPLLFAWRLEAGVLLLVLARPSLHVFADRSLASYHGLALNP